MSRKAEEFQFSYDRKFDVLFLYKKGAKSAGGVDYGNVTFDLDEEKRMVGIEIVEATEFLAYLTSLSKVKISKSLSTISGQEDAFQQQLVKRGMVESSAKDKFQQETQTCIFCGEQSGFTDTFCTNCKRPLSKESLKAEIEDKEQFKEDFEMMRNVLEKLKEHLPDHIMEGLASP